MKNKIMFLGLLSFFMMASCAKKEEKTTETIEKTTIVKDTVIVKDTIKEVEKDETTTVKINSDGASVKTGSVHSIIGE